RHTLAREIVRPDLPVTRRYQTLLDDKTIDCIVAAVPDHWHRQLVVDTVSAGKDIYCEKPMSHTAADGVAMVDAAKRSGRIVQIGSQRVSSQICAKAKELIAQGMIGDLMLVEGWLGRNSPDVHAVLYYFGDLPVYMRLNLGTAMPETYRFQGSKGVLEVTGSTLSFTPQSGKDEYPSYYTGSYPKALRDAYVTKWHQDNDPALGQAPMPETIAFKGPDWD